ncbi:hypothetical protein JX265_003907 [Neoarthrinium moseri]|uniref:Uncharacterized protein n=1 Tax=Neoarthrinium moseri TaxID=1658444 RepID=A0A9P9WRH4_9PEZI|nr:uncharacterized protein JN550_009471 [Neoarthrinium moseri]KAI1853759.1 hypothetical protein JX266_001743 [Neoarthrinium moseri]KAI1863771.1 hypothetical protein JN550_009471 [Neoarthrinium moseri]KAI1876381.1 hypothetical protein JX265_003907 [Neoarthrinium moseri]
MSSQDYSTVSMPFSPSPPTDLPSYARFMHQHTKKQMEAASRSSHRRGQRSSHSGVPAVPNGISSSGSSHSSEGVDYHD